MINTLSIRQYTKQKQHHSHHYFQLVLPIMGTIQIEVEDYSGQVSVGECVIIRTGQEHHFRAEENARFIVADMEEIPTHFMNSEQAVFSISAPLLSYLYFVEKQLAYQVDQTLETAMFTFFLTLLNHQSTTLVYDSRVRNLQQYISDHLAAPLNLSILAETACLSTTQLKTVFKQHTGKTVFQYLTEQRMEKARALLTHTDLPIQLVAERVGYQDASAFTRRFSRHFGLSPKQIQR